MPCPLEELRSRRGLSYSFIARQLAVVEVLCPRVVVMYLGRTGELGTRQQVLRDPRHPYTQALCAAVPVLGRAAPARGPSGEPPSPASPPSGWSLHPRCPRARPRCAQEVPDLSVGGIDRPCACFYANEPKKLVC